MKGMTTMELFADSYSVQLDSIGEGWDGEAREGEDRLVRFYVRYCEDWHWDCCGVWEDVEGCSYCTQIPDTAPTTVLARAASLILRSVLEARSEGRSLKGLCERLSWLALDRDGRLVLNGNPVI